ncbi:Acyltransferase [Yersinia kristensenii ATCC 33638]|nr:Acyltransferase [Yersinia kristensenii ATCC 33638]
MLHYCAFEEKPPMYSVDIKKITNRDHFVEFRKDINGLRAIAVIAVIIFHFNHSWLPGGFAGVDVFFVISGFLMTKIILTGLDSNSFSILKFYSARAKRIVPALSAVCAICLLAGWFILLPKDFLELATNAISSMLFYSNYLYASQTGYFDTSSLDNILLHTWSLSVEWQFYIVYPLALLLIHYILGGKLTRRAIFIGAAISFGISVYRTPIYPTESYFTLNARAWEMLSGGVAFILNEARVIKNRARLCEIAGLTMIAASYIVFTNETLWPSYNAMLPVLGTVLVIIANRNNSLVTSNFAMQFIGKISYSLYLVHWPLIVFARKVDIDLNLLIYVIIAALLAFSIYYIIETNNRFSFANLSMFVLAVSGAIFIQKTIGADFRVPEELRLTNEQFKRKFYGGYGYEASKPYLSNADNGVDFIIFGDSLAAQYAKEIDEKKLKSVNMFFHGCPIMPDYSRFKDNKEDINCSKAYGELVGLFDKYENANVIFSSAWDKYKDQLIKRGGNHAEKLSIDQFYDVWIEEIKKIIEVGGDRHYYIIGIPIPTNPNAYGCLAQNVLPGYALFAKCSPTRKKFDIAINNKLKEAFSKNENVTFIDPNTSLCRDNECLVTVDKSPVYIDGLHLSTFGSKIVFDDIYKTITDSNIK